MANGNDLLSRILNEEFLGTLAKSADLYKIGSNSILDPEEIRIGLKVVPRAVMSLLISELTPMALNASKDIKLPFGKDALIRTNKNAADDYTGSVYDNNKLVYSFQNRSIPGLGIILLSTFELYDLEELDKPTVEAPRQDLDGKIQKLIDERMELHSLVGKVVENKIAEREAIHKLMMSKLTEALNTPVPAIHPAKVAEPALPVPHAPLPEGPIDLEAKDVMKKEAPAKKGSPLKEFMDRKKPKEYNVEMTKSEVVDCGDCGQTIFGSTGFSGCICFGSDQNSKIWIKKSENGVQLRFSKGWNAENIELLLETLRGSK